MARLQAASLEMARLRMSRLWRFPRWPLICVVAFFFLFYVLLQMPRRFPLLSLDSRSPPALLATPRMPDTGSPSRNLTCSANDSTEVISPHLPEPYQEFLRIRQCRVFPTLLTPSPCEDDLYLLLAIKSTAVQLERRAAVRDTWGQAGRIRGRQVKLVFLMGRSPDRVQGKDLQPLLEWESHRYGDILQWDFVDRFLNLSRKELGFLSWFSRECRNAQFAFKGDDDVFVNTDNLIEFLENHQPNSHLLAGYIHQPELPIRDRNSKYYVPVEMYPDNKLYPAFPSGGGYLMTRQTVLGLHVAAQKVALFPLDDVFLGLCLHQMNINLTHHNLILSFGLHGLKDPCVYHEVLMVHRFSPFELRTTWALMQQGLPCGQ